MSDRATHKLFCIFSLIFIIAFSTVIAFSVFDNNIYAYSPLAISGVAVITILLLAAVKWRLGKIEELLRQRFYMIVWFFFIVMLAVQLYFLLRFRHDPAYDMAAVYKNAITWAKDGTLHTYRSDFICRDYFYRYPNNLPVTAVLAVLFKISGWFGIKDMFMTASVFNSVLVSLAFVVTILVSMALLKERLLWWHWLGIAVIMIGVVGTNYFQQAITQKEVKNSEELGVRS